MTLISDFEKLTKLLMDLPDGAMLHEELDGFVSAVIVCPQLIMPSEWLPHVWHRDHPVGKDMPFENMEEANEALRLVMWHYNLVAQSLMPTEDLGYSPILSSMQGSDEEVSMIWADGFQRALDLWPDAFMKILASDDAEARDALANLRSLDTVSSIRRKKPKTEEDLDALHFASGDNIAEWVTILADWRMANEITMPASSFSPFAHVGRNDPCPCGSGKKFKKCHGMS